MDNLLNFFSMPAFWGLIIWCLITYGVASNAKTASSSAFISFVAANIEAAIGLWEPFTWYILAITWIFAAIFFETQRRMGTGGK